MAVIEDASGAGLERKPWWFHGLSEAQADGTADRPAPISLRSFGSLLSEQLVQFSMSTATHTGIEGDPVRNAG